MEYALYLVAKYNGLPSKNKPKSWLIIGDPVDARIQRQTNSKKIC